MTDLISRNLTDLGIMLLAGIGMMMIFDVMNLVGGVFQSKKASQVMYVMSFLFMSKVFAECLYEASYGKISLHAIGATLVGIILWKKIIYDIIAWGSKNEKTKEKGKD